MNPPDLPESTPEAAPPQGVPPQGGSPARGELSIYLSFLVTTAVKSSGVILQLVKWLHYILFWRATGFLCLLLLLLCLHAFMSLSFQSAAERLVPRRRKKVN